MTPRRIKQLLTQAARLGLQLAPATEGCSLGELTPFRPHSKMDVVCIRTAASDGKYPMIAALNRQNGAGLVLNIVSAVLLAGVANALIAFAGFSGPTHLIQPAGFRWIDRVVGYVWVVLFALLATGRWLLLRSDSANAVSHAKLLVWLICACALYPIYTLGLQLVPGLIGNLAVLSLAGWIACRIWSSSRVASAFTFLVVLWVSIATVYVIRLIQLNS